MTMTSALTRLSIALGVYLLSASAPASPYALDQNWSAKDLAIWQDTSQGSRLIPLDWMMALELEGSKVPFMSDANIRAYGYTPNTYVFDYKSYRLPRGFVVDRQNDEHLTFSHQRWKAGQGVDEPWVGMNCAACHTANLSYGGYTWQVEGGPTNADFQGFLEAFRGALRDTQQDDEKFARFAAKVLDGADSASNRQSLHVALATLNQFMQQGAALNQTDLLYGPGRVDAVGHILNRVAQLNGAVAPTPNPSNAPVSYPFLWNTPQHDKVQWNGVAPNKRLGKDGLDVGALARNASEVVGVFGDVAFRSDTYFKGFASSVPIKQLDLLERTLARLKPPKWPDKLGEPLDDTKAQVGAGLFAKHCASCHAVMSRDELKKPITAMMATISRDTEGPQSITTDPWMACNAVQFISDPGKLEGAHLNALTGRVTRDTPLVTQLGVTAREVLLNQMGDLLGLALLDFLNVQPVRQQVQIKGFSLFALKSARAQRLDECYKLTRNMKENPTLAYKARPLNGIWATAPYLHNGSVRTLYELLLPPAKRAPSFKVGTIEFDPVRVGYVDAFGPGKAFTYDTSLPGNSNAGHDYGASALDDEQRFALIEYMKRL